MSRPENKFGRYGQQSTSSSSRNSQKYMDSGKSSDSSISSAHGYRRLTESGGGMVGAGGSLRMGTHSTGAMQNKKPSTDSSNHRMLQESSSSHNIPHISLPSPHHSQPSPHHQKLSYSASNSSDLAANNSPSHSVSTPQLKKKLNFDKNGSSSREGAITKHQSFDYSGSE
jgi:Rho GTPase-activating protein 39